MKDIFPILSNAAYALPLALGLELWAAIPMALLGFTSGAWHIMELKAKYEHNGRTWRGYPAYIFRRIDVWNIYLAFAAIAAVNISLWLFLLFPLYLLFEWVLPVGNRFTSIGTSAAIAIICSYFGSELWQIVAALLLFAAAVKVAEEAQPHGQVEHSIWHVLTATAMTLLIL